MLLAWFENVLAPCRSLVVLASLCDRQPLQILIGLVFVALWSSFLGATGSGRTNSAPRAICSSKVPLVSFSCAHTRVVCHPPFVSFTALAPASPAVGHSSGCLLLLRGAAYFHLLLVRRHLTAMALGALSFPNALATLLLMMLALLPSRLLSAVHPAVLGSLLLSAVARVAASLAGALLVGGIVAGVVRVGVGRAHAGAFHRPAHTHSPRVAGCVFVA